MANIWLLSLLFLVIFLLLAAFRRSKRQQHRKPPSPPGFPIIGNLHQLGELQHQSLWRLSKKYGHVMLVKLGKVPMVILSSPETARQALKDHDLSCCNRPSLAGPRELSYNNLDIGFSPFGDYHKEVRKLAVQELFSTKQVHSIQPIKEEEVKKLIDSIAKSASLKTPVNLNKEFLALTVSVLCRVAFGVSFEDTVLSNGTLNKLVREGYEMLGSFSASDYIPYVGWIVDRYTGLQGRREKSMRDLDAFYEQMFDLHKEGKEKGSEDFVDLLLRLVKEETVFGNDKFTRNHIKAILMNILLPGIDTSSITMTWAMAELARNPRVMKKVQSEIRHQVENKTMISLDDIDQLHYLKMVIKETWRLHPPAPLLVPREVISEFEINGYKIGPVANTKSVFMRGIKPVAKKSLGGHLTIYLKKLKKKKNHSGHMPLLLILYIRHWIGPKTQLYVNVWAIGRDPDTWKDPEVFLPERFMDSDIDPKGKNFELLTFGSGRRICPGIYMATTMVELGLANMLYHFNWKLPEGVLVEDIDMEESPGLTVSKKNELVLVPVKYCDH